MPPSSSKQQQAASSSTIQVQVSDKSELGKSFPLIAKFATSKPNDVHFDTSNDNHARFTSFEKEGEVALVGETKRMQWVASSKNKLEQGVKYALGIFDKKAQVLNVLPMDQLFSLKQRPKHVDATSNEDVEFNDWLGKRVTKRIKQQKTTLGKKVVMTQMTFSKGDLSSIDALLPPGYDRNAKNVMDIFPLHSVLPNAVYTTMTCATVEELATKAEERTQKADTRGFKMAVACCEKVYDKKEDNEEAVYLLEYAILLAQLYVKAKSEFKVSKYFEETEKSPVTLYMRETFTERQNVNKKRAISDSNKKKLVLHLLIALLRVFGGRIPGYVFDALIADLAMTRNRVFTYTHLLGCTKDTSAVGGIVLQLQKEKKAK